MLANGMVDRISSEARSALMSRVGQRNTKPELIVRKILHARGWRYRLHAKALPGTPDIVFPALRKAVFVHGCFWHGHNCKLGKVPATRREFWLQKLAANQDRDHRQLSALEELGWTALTVWQCELSQSEELLIKLERFLAASNTSGAAAKKMEAV